MNELIEKDFDKLAFDDYIKKIVERMSAIKFPSKSNINAYVNGERKKIIVEYFKIEEFFKNKEELESSGRRNLYEGFEQENYHYYKNDGSILISSIFPVYLYDEKLTKKEIDFDPRFFAVANLYPYIMEKYPNYAKNFISENLHQYSIKQDGSLKLTSYEAIEDSTKKLEDDFMEFFEGDVEDSQEADVATEFFSFE